MQTSVRTTVRIREDLLTQSKLLALNNGTTVQQVINDALAMGFGHITDLDTHKLAMSKIDQLRKKSLKGRKINIKKIIEQNKKEVQGRADSILGNLR